MSEKESAMKESIFKILEDTKALQFGDFTLASGAKSKY